MRNNLPPKCCQVWKTYRISYRRPSGCFKLTTSPPTQKAHSEHVAGMTASGGAAFALGSSISSEGSEGAYLVRTGSACLRYRVSLPPERHRTVHNTRRALTGYRLGRALWVFHTGRDYKKRTSIHSTIRFRLNQQL
ncbi:unnamed protein product [Ixodes persulcatus]